MKHIAIFRLIQWFTDVFCSKINDLFFSLFFLNIFLLLLVQKNIWYEIFEAISELSLFPTNPDKPTSEYFWFFAFSVIKSSVFNKMCEGVLSLQSINLLSVYDFFG